jgi:hypothetical protein
MALTAYVQQVQRLVNDPTGQFYNPTDLAVYVNLARGTIATQAECLVANGTLSTVNGTQTYALSSLAGPAGLISAVNVRSVRSVIAGVGRMLDARPWPWFNTYQLTGLNLGSAGPPTVWSQQTQGVQGSLWFSPTPNGTVALTVEAAWIPIPLVNDSTVEVLSYPWTDAVPYFAAYLAYENAQRLDDAKRMQGLFNAFMIAARVGVTPMVGGPSWPPGKGFQSPIDAAGSLLPNGKPAQSGEGGLG